MLRSRSKRAEEFHWEEEELAIENLELDLPTSCTSNSLRRKSRMPSRSTRRRPRSHCFKTLLAFASLLCLLALVLLFVLLLYGRSGIRQVAFSASSKILALKFNLEARSDLDFVEARMPLMKKSKTPLARGKLPVVDRSILQKLALLEQEEGYEYDHLLPPQKDHRLAWPPLVTHIPEPAPLVTQNQMTNAPGSPNQPQFQFQHIPPSLLSFPLFSQSTCGAPKCLYLLPLRVPEQESKARLHFAQIMELGRKLGRTVVLPGVGKSRMGGCARWEFGKYYHVDRLGKQLAEGRVIDAEAFRVWSATRPGVPTAQFLSIESKPLAGSTNHGGDVIFSEQGVTAHIPLPLSNTKTEIEIQADPDPDPRCLPIKYPRLNLHAFRPLTIHPPLRGKERKGAFGESLVKLIKRDDVRWAGAHSVSRTEQEGGEEGAGQEPDVLVLNYDLRHPLFPLSSVAPVLQLEYAPALITLASKLNPATEDTSNRTRNDNNYLVIHWRMETVPPEVLPTCAERLVDTLVGLLVPQTRSRTRNDEATEYDWDYGAVEPEPDVESEQGEELRIKTVWFASDYPYPISLPNSVSFANPSAKSGTFKTLTSSHFSAISILRNAFGPSGPLGDVKLTGLREEIGKLRDHAVKRNEEVIREGEGREEGTGIGIGIGIDGEMADDSGVLGILDKLVAMRARVFVSGGKGCGRVRCVFLRSFCSGLVLIRKK